MPSLSSFLLIACASLALGSPIAEPLVTPAAELKHAKRGTTCTFSGSNGAAEASSSQKDCATIVLSNVAVPSGVTLELSDLNEGTNVSPLTMNPQHDF